MILCVYRRLKIPRATLQFSESIIELERDGNKLNFKNGRLIGEQIEAEITGFIRLSKRLERSRLQLKIFVKFSSELELMVKAFLKDARQDDGSYLINITGMIMQPNFQQKTRGNRSSNASKAKPNRSKRTDKNEKIEETPEEEESRIKREEQREKRLERQKKRMEERQRRMQNSPKVAPNQQKLTPRDLPIRSNIGNVEFDDEVDISDDEEEEEEEEEEEVEEDELSDDEDMDEEE